MKTICLFLIAVLFVTCTNSEKTEQKKRTVIAGNVSNFSEVSEHVLIQIIFPDILAEQIKQESIDKNGNFKFVIDINHPSEFYLKYSGLLTYFISPGDSMFFNINNKCWSIVTPKNTDEYSFYNLSGTNSEINHDVTKFITLFNDSVFNWEKESDTVKTLEPLAYLGYKELQLKNNYEFLEDFIIKENTSSQFEKWAKNYLKYTNWTALMEYRWAYPMKAELPENPFEYVHKMPAEYFSFLNEQPNERTEALQTSKYYNFLNEFAIYTDQIIPLDTQKIYATKIEENFDKTAHFFLRYYNESNTGFLKDILISKFYYRLLDAKFFTKVKTVFDATQIEDVELREIVKAKFDFEKKLFESPDFAVGTQINELKDENEFLQELTKKYQGKVIYIDFWAPWCAPCMAEMPYAKRLKEKFAGKDVVFVYLANRCEEAAWKVTIAEQKIEGEHFLLTDNQYSVLSDIFKIQGIPHYVLLDKSGNIIFSDAPRPGNNMLDNEIDKLLKLNL